MNLHIEEPCHKNWNAMTSQDKGRYCGSCCKTVFDFTKMPTDEVIQFISTRKNDSICGRFTSEQVTIPETTKQQLKISWNFKKFLAAIVIVFGGALFTGCDNELTGKMVRVETSSDESTLGINPDTVIPKTISKDTVPVKKDTVEIHYMGRISGPKPKKEVAAVPVIEEPTIVGLTALIPGKR